jgi:hypothetical protein
VVCPSLLYPAGGVLLAQPAGVPGATLTWLKAPVSVAWPTLLFPTGQRAVGAQPAGVFLPALTAVGAVGLSPGRHRSALNRPAPSVRSPGALPPADLAEGAGRGVAVPSPLFPSERAAGAQPAGANAAGADLAEGAGRGPAWRKLSPSR